MEKSFYREQTVLSVDEIETYRRHSFSIDTGPRLNEVVLPPHNGLSEDNFDEIRLHCTTLPSERSSYPLDPSQLQESELQPVLSNESQEIMLSMVRAEEPFIREQCFRGGDTSQSEENQGAFPWVIATTKSGHEPILQNACLRLFGRSFEDLSIPKDSGLKKTSWQDGLLNAHISRFEVDPKDPLRVKRHLVELLVGRDGLIAVDHAGQDGHLCELRTDINERRVPRNQFATVLSLTNLIVERQLEGNEKILDRLERWIDYYAEIVTSGPLPKHDAHVSIPKLMKTLEFYHRKVGQTAEVLTALEEMGHELSGTDTESSQEAWRFSESRLRALLSHSAAAIRKLDHVEELHDRQKKSLVDANIERFTVIIGLSAPPIIGDIVSKFFLEHLPYTHKYVILGSLLVGAALVLRAEVPKWYRGLRLAWNRWRNRDTKDVLHGMPPSP